MGSERQLTSHQSPFQFPSISERNIKASSSSKSPYYDLTFEQIELTEPHKDRGGLRDRRKRWRWGFNRVFSPNSTQEDVWEAAEPLVQSVLDGKNVVMFAYG